MNNPIFGIIAMVGLLAVIGAKYITMAKLQSFQRIVAEAETETHRIKAELKAAENNKAVAELGLKTEEGNQLLHSTAGSGGRRRCHRCRSGRRQ